MTEMHIQFIESVKEKLGDGADRIASRPHPFRKTWWPEQPTIEDQLLSDFHMSGEDVPELTEAYKAEVSAIRAVGESSGVLSDPDDADSSEWMEVRATEQADILKIWEGIAVPVRRIGNTVFRIMAPRDLMGSPLIQAMPVDDYIAGVSRQTADDAAVIAELEDRLKLWRPLAIVIGIAFVVMTIAAY